MAGLVPVTPQARGLYRTLDLKGSDVTVISGRRAVPREPPLIVHFTGKGVFPGPPGPRGGRAGPGSPAVNAGGAKAVGADRGADAGGERPAES